MSAPDKPTGRIRVLIVEDHPVVAEGLSSLLEDYSQIMVTGMAFSVAEVIPVAERAAADVAVIDYHLPDGTAYDAVDQLRSRWPATPVVLITADGGNEPLMAAIDLGASGYLVKSADGEEIAGTIRAAAAGLNVMPADAVVRAMALYRDRAQQRAMRSQLDSLTARERQVLGLMTSGADNRTMAGRLHISYATVRTHVRSILAKLGARSQLEAVAKAKEWGFRG